MALYKYETHLHTSETSKCGATSGADFARHFKQLGYTGIFVTDHFLAGNTTVPDNLSWPDRIALFGHGYDMAAQTGREVGLDVFFGWEHNYGWAHYLTYGLSRDWLLANPDMLGWDILTYCDRVRADGGYVIHAHPFRERVDIVQLIPRHVDAVEVLNGGRDDAYNRHALDYASSFGLAQTAGSDIHSIASQRRCGIACPHRLRDAHDYIRTIQSGEATIFDEHLPWPAKVATAHRAIRIGSR